MDSYNNDIWYGLVGYQDFLLTVFNRYARDGISSNGINHVWFLIAFLLQVLSWAVRWSG